MSSASPVRAILRTSLHLHATRSGGGDCGGVRPRPRTACSTDLRSGRSTRTYRARGWTSPHHPRQVRLRRRFAPAVPRLRGVADVVHWESRAARRAILNGKRLGERPSRSCSCASRGDDAISAAHIASGHRQTLRTRASGDQRAAYRCRTVTSRRTCCASRGRRSLRFRSSVASLRTLECFSRNAWAGVSTCSGGLRVSSSRDRLEPAQPSQSARPAHPRRSPRHEPSRAGVGQGDRHEQDGRLVRVLFVAHPSKKRSSGRGS
jgi:hypothetical protein